MPGELGTYCALTGERFGIADAVARGHRDASRAVGALSRRCSTGLTGTVSVDAVLAAFAEPAGEGPIMRRKATIDRLFAGDRVEDILAALDAKRLRQRRRRMGAAKPPPRYAPNRRSA